MSLSLKIQRIALKKKKSTIQTTQGRTEGISVVVVSACWCVWSILLYEKKKPIHFLCKFCLLVLFLCGEICIANSRSAPAIDLLQKVSEVEFFFFLQSVVRNNTPTSLKPAKAKLQQIKCTAIRLMECGKIPARLRMIRRRL